MTRLDRLIDIRYSMIFDGNKSWLVVSTPLKNISQLGVLFPIYGKIKNVPNHQPAKNPLSQIAITADEKHIGLEQAEFGQVEHQDVGHAEKNRIFPLLSCLKSGCSRVIAHGISLRNPKELGNGSCMIIYFRPTKKCPMNFDPFPYGNLSKCRTMYRPFISCLKMFSGCTYCSQPQTFQL